MNTLYNRQESLNLTIPKSTSIIGCGGVGAWLGIYSAMIGIQEIHLFDSDVIEISNLNRLPYPIEAIATRKTEELKRIIQELRPNIKVIAHDNIDIEYISPQLLLCDYIFDCTDNYSVQKAIYKYTKDNKKKYIRGGYDGNHITITSNIPEWDIEETDVSGYSQPPTPSYIIPASIIASLMLMYAINNKTPELSGDIKEIRF